MVNRSQMLADRDAGMTYQQIVDKYGVSWSLVNKTIGKQNPKHFKAITEKSCVYPYLRRWMNENRVNAVRLVELMDLEPHGVTVQSLRNIMHGGNPRKNWIDKLLKITGLTYEKLFALEVDDGK